jgi:hypothetical protein
MILPHGITYKDVARQMAVGETIDRIAEQEANYLNDHLRAMGRKGSRKINRRGGTFSVERIK